MSTLIELPADDPSIVRLYDARKGRSSYQEREQPRFFQLFTDQVYTTCAPFIHLPNKKVVLHTTELGGFGDVAHLVNFWKMVKKNRPDAGVELILDGYKKTRAEVKQVFPNDPIQFLERDTGNWDGTIDAYMKKGCALGVAQGIGNIYHSHHRSVYEYGAGVREKYNNLSMGLRDDEEGLDFPELTARSLFQMQSPWLKNAMNIHSALDVQRYVRERSLYFMYIPSWSLQIPSLYAIAKIESAKRERSIDVFMPMKFSLQQYIAWGILDKEALKEHGIGKITMVKSDSIETIDLGNGRSKELRILNGIAVKEDMEALQSNCEPLFGSTGDISVSEGIVLDKIPIYDNLGHKNEFVEAWSGIANLLEYKKYKEYWDLFRNYAEQLKKIFELHKVRGKCFWGDPNSYELEQEHSVYRKAINAGIVVPEIKALAHNVARLYPLISEESRAFNAHLQRCYNFKPRLLALVDRGMILANYPDLIPLENRLLEEYRAGQKTESQIKEELRSAILAKRKG